MPCVRPSCRRRLVLWLRRCAPGIAEAPDPRRKAYISILVNNSVSQARVPAPSTEAPAFHAALRGYQVTPMRELPDLAAELGIGAVLLKDESNRFGLPAFKVLGASWAIERALRARPEAHTLVAASAGNHGRAVAHLAAQRNLRCRVLLPTRASSARRTAIQAEGAEVVVIDGGFEDLVARAVAEGAKPGAVEIADFGDSDPAVWVIDGYATLFAEAAAQTVFDLIVVPVGGGSLAAAAARHAADTGVCVIGVEPATAACLTASLAAGAPTSVSAPGTSMAGLDCAEVSPAAWPSVRYGVHGMVTVEDGEVHAAMRELAAAGLTVGDCGAAPLAALRRLVSDTGGAALRDAVALGPETRVLLIATEGATDPDAYRRVVGSSNDQARG